MTGSATESTRPVMAAARCAVTRASQLAGGLHAYDIFVREVVRQHAGVRVIEA